MLKKIRMHFKLAIVRLTLAYLHPLLPSVFSDWRRKHVAQSAWLREDQHRWRPTACKHQDHQSRQSPLSAMGHQAVSGPFDARSRQYQMSIQQNTIHQYQCCCCHLPDQTAPRDDVYDAPASEQLEKPTSSCDMPARLEFLPTNILRLHSMCERSATALIVKLNP